MKAWYSIPFRHISQWTSSGASNNHGIYSKSISKCVINILVFFSMCTSYIAINGTPFLSMSRSFYHLHTKVSHDILILRALCIVWSHLYKVPNYPSCGLVSQPHVLCNHYLIMVIYNTTIYYHHIKLDSN